MDMAEPQDKRKDKQLSNEDAAAEGWLVGNSLMFQGSFNSSLTFYFFMEFSFFPKMNKWCFNQLNLTSLYVRISI